MKNLGKIKLSRLDQTELSKREMKQVIGGRGNCCGCGCNGPSSTSDNAKANWNGGYPNSNGGETHCACYGDDEWGSGW